MNDSGDNRFSAFVQDNNGKISNSYVDIEFSGAMRGLFVGENRIESGIAEVSNSYIIGNAEKATSIESDGSLGFMLFHFLRQLIQRFKLTQEDIVRWHCKCQL